MLMWHDDTCIRHTYVVACSGISATIGHLVIIIVLLTFCLDYCNVLIIVYNIYTIPIKEFDEKHLYQFDIDVNVS